MLTVCLGVLQEDGAVKRDLARIHQRFLDQTGWVPVRHRFVAGALRYTQYGWFKRMVMKWIAGNAGHEGAVVVARVRELTGDEGFNAQTHVYENLVEAGVIDPTKVVRCALQNAASVASLLLTTDVVVCEMPAEKSESPRGGGLSPDGEMY